MNQSLVSIIVPVYKVENYLDLCLKSIERQSYDNLEIILVDDGSPDCCGNICDNYAEQDKRVRVIHKENGGLSSARNAGMKVMSGKYVTFIDSDDYVSPKYVEHLVAAIQKDDSDLAVSWFKEVGEDEKTRAEITGRNIVSYQRLNQKEAFRRLLYQDGIEMSAWGKLYKTNLINGLEYPEGELYEDIPVTTGYLFRCKSISVIGNVDYFYLQRNSSIQYQKFNKRKMAGIYHIEEMARQVLHRYPDLQSAAYCRELSCACNLLFQIAPGTSLDCQEYLWAVVQRTRGKVLCDSKARKKARLAAFISYLGKNTLSKIYHLTQSRG